MIFNKKKYNIMVVITLTLICLATIFLTVDYSSIQITKDPDQSYAEDEQPGEDIGNEEQDKPSEPVEDEKENENEEDKFEKLNVSFNNGWSALNYALNLLNKYDYKIQLTQTINAKDTTFGQGGIQRISKEIYNVGGVGYIKSVADGSDVPLGMGENYTDYIVVNQTSVLTKRENGQTENYSVEGYLEKYGYLPNGLPYIINRNSAQLYLSVINPKDVGSSYYKLDITLNSKAWEGYLTNLEATGGSESNPQIKSIKVTIKIDKTYGCITSITATETYTIKRAGFTANVTSEIAMSYKYFGNYETATEEIKSKVA